MKRLHLSDKFVSTILTDLQARAGILSAIKEKNTIHIEYDEAQITENQIENFLVTKLKDRITEFDALTVDERMRRLARRIGEI